MSKRRCDSCDFWLPVEAEGRYEGECRALAPLPMWVGPDDAVEDFVWPCTAADSWCGQWRPKPAVEVCLPCARCLYLQGLVEILTARLAEK